MKKLEDILLSLSDLEDSLKDACDWLMNIAQIQEIAVDSNINKRGLLHKNWKGAFRGEYAVSTREWGFFCPVWHGGQAVKALCFAHNILKDRKYLESAKLGAEFIMNQQITSGSDAGLILAYEDKPDKVNVSAVLEAMDGLFVLAAKTKEQKYNDAALAAVKWCKDKAWLKGQGLVLDLYDPDTKSFIEYPYIAKNNGQGRPLADDAVLLTAFSLTGKQEYRIAFYEILEKLLSDERPAGNWVDYGPAEPHKGLIHPRHAYWWGLPMIKAWQDTNDSKWLDAAIRSGTWYIKAQRTDGGLFRETSLDFKTPSFGHATSGIMCASILWLELFKATLDPQWLKPISKAIKFGMNMQFKNPKDENLKGCILEKVLPPDGTDSSPYYIRDLGTIFFIQVVALILEEIKAVNDESTTKKLESIHSSISIFL